MIIFRIEIWPGVEKAPPEIFEGGLYTLRAGHVYQ